MTATALLDGDSDAGISAAVELLMHGAIVGVPTETVYGLAANAGIDDAVSKIFVAKGRPSTHPLILHVADIERARSVAEPWPPSAEILGTTFWPGPLTLLVRRADSVSTVVTGGRDTVAVRIPDHPVLARLLEQLARRGCVGVAAPSANTFGGVSPTTARHVLADLDGRIDAVVDGGECTVGLESTIVDCTGDVPRLLRPGGTPAEAIRSALSKFGVGFDDRTVESSSDAIAPGMLASHYAPRARVETFDDIAALEARKRQLDGEGIPTQVLPHPDDLGEYSKTLYSALRECDAAMPNVILALLPDNSGLGRAIRDRLNKASADR